MGPARLDEVQYALRAHRPRAAPIPAATRRAAVAAVLRERDELELLFIRRAEHPSDPWSGHMAFPGGRVDPTDPSPLHAAVREAREEVALDLERHGHLLGELSHLPASARGKPIPMVVHPFVFAVGATLPTLVPDTREVQETLWVPLSFLSNDTERGTLERVYEDVTMTLPCYRYQGRTIWGLTLRMVDELVEVLRAPPGD